VRHRERANFACWLFLMACGGPLPHPPFAAQATSALVPLEFDPPPGRVEVIPPRPPQADAWVDGEWILRHGRWYWLLGRWVKTPAGATYSPWVSVRAADGTAWYAPGVWRDSQGRQIGPPSALAIATASAETVVDPEGHLEDTGRTIKTAPPPRPREQDAPPAPPTRSLTSP
jgi:hypothetical protein